MKKMIFKKMFFTVGFGLMLMGCNAEDDLLQQDPDQANAAGTVAEFKVANPGPMILEGTYVDLINNSQNAKSYLWDLGDGSTSTEAAPHHLYPKCGNYAIKLTVTDVEGKQTSVEDMVDIFCTVPMHRANPTLYRRN